VDIIAVLSVRVAHSGTNGWSNMAYWA